jgi:hypothetical protein
VELTPWDEMTLVSDNRIISVLAITIAVSLESKLPVVPVRLRELQFCMLKLSGARGLSAAPATRKAVARSVGFFCNSYHVRHIITIRCFVQRVTHG